MFECLFGYNFNNLDTFVIHVLMNKGDFSATFQNSIYLHYYRDIIDPDHRNTCFSPHGLFYFSQILF